MKVIKKLLLDSEYFGSIKIYNMEIINTRTYKVVQGQDSWDNRIQEFYTFTLFPAVQTPLLTSSGYTRWL